MSAAFRAVDLLARCARSVGRCAAVTLVLLNGCGGSAGDAEPPPTSSMQPSLSGRVVNGIAPTDLRVLQVTVKGNVGTARTAEGRIVPVDGTDYLASLDQLSGPYLLSDSANSPSTLSLYSVASASGTANLTPLTTLIVAELLGTDPGAYYEALGTRGGFTAASESAIAIAEQRVRRLLQRDYGFLVPPAVGPFVTTPFSPVAGDPMYDTVNALVAALGTNGDMGSVVAAVAQESGRCKVERVAVAGATVTDDFCPFTRSSDTDPGDAGVRVFEFANRRGDTLKLRARGAVVVDLTMRTKEDVVSQCAGTACANVTVGAPAGDQTQAITFAGTRLTGASGTLALSGSLRSAAPGIPLPGLPCTENLFYLVDEAARRADGYCAASAGLGLNEAGQSAQSGATRRKYTFNDGLGGPSLEVVVQGASVVSALVYTSDANTGATVPQFLCQAAACTGILLGATVVDLSLGVPVVLQPIRFDRAVLPGILPDGTPTTTSITVQAALTGFHVDDPNAPPFTPVACPAGAPTVSVRPSDETAAILVCAPGDAQGFTLLSTTADASGNIVLSLANLLSDGNGGFATGNAVNVTISPAGDVLSATFDAFIGPQYRCAGASCQGVQVTATGPAGERTVLLNAATLTEVGTGGLTGDRTATLDGSFVAPAVP